MKLKGKAHNNLEGFENLLHFVNMPKQLILDFTTFHVIVIVFCCVIFCVCFFLLKNKLWA